MWCNFESQRFAHNDPNLRHTNVTPLLQRRIATCMQLPLNSMCQKPYVAASTQMLRGPFATRTSCISISFLSVVAYEELEAIPSPSNKMYIKPVGNVGNFLLGIKGTLIVFSSVWVILIRIHSSSTHDCMICK